MKKIMDQSWHSLKNSHPNELKSSLYSVNCIITCTLNSNSILQTQQIFECLTKPNGDFRVYDMRNDFANSELGTRDYRYIKLILATIFTP